MSETLGSGPRVGLADPQVNLYAAHVEESVRFYRDVLGFTETFRIPKSGAPSHVELRLAGLTLGIAGYEALRRDHGIRTGPGPARLEVALATDDVDGAYAWATAHGAPPVSPPYDFLGTVHAARTADPEGNFVVFHTRLPAGAAHAVARPTFRSHLINLLTGTLESSLQFYHGLLGFTETFRAPAEGPPAHVEMELGSLHLGVSTLEALRRDHGVSAGGGPPRGELVLWVRDADAAHSWMLARGAPSLSPPHDFAGVLRAAWVADPDGSPVQMVARR